MKRFIRQAWTLVPLRAVVTVSILLIVSRAGAQNSQFLSDAAGNLSAQISETVALPVILGQPRNQIVIPGESASFGVVVADAQGVSYQWYSNTTAITGATADALMLTNVGTNYEGQYSVIVSNASGPVLSSPANLYIDSDGDGLPDSWEIAHFGNLSQTATGDPDGDGVSNLQEFLDSTDPTNAASVLYRIILLNDGGTVTAVPNQSAYTKGQVVTLTAYASNGAPFHAWTGDVISRSNSITVTMTNNVTLFARFQPFTLKWTNTVSGDWNVAANWFPGLVPGSNESVVIAPAVVVTLNSNVDLLDLTLGALNGGPDLSGSGKVTVSGLGTWFSGNMSGNGATIVRPGGTFTIANVSTVNLNGRTFENQGTTIWLNGGIMGMNAGVITNDAGALFQLAKPSSFNYAGGVPRFDNAGTFLTATNGTTALSGVQFNNYGNVPIQGGMLLMGGGGYQTGTITVPAGTTVNYFGGVFNCTASSSITGAGTFMASATTANFAGTVAVTGGYSFPAGTANFTGNYTCTGNTLLDISGGGAVNFDGTGTVAPNILNLNGGLGGANTVTVSNAMNWTGGSMYGSGRTIIQPAATLSIAGFTGYGGVGLSDRTLENKGSVMWGGGNLNMGGAGVITNDAGASFQIQNIASFNYGGGSPRFDNVGTFLPSPSGTTAFYGIAFNNYGTINLGGASFLSLGGGGVQVGVVTVPAGATFSYAGGTFTASGASTITGAGTFLVSTGTANMGGIVNVTGTNSFTGGTANLTGNYSCVGNTLLNIAGGTAYFDGSGPVTPNILNLNGILGGANTVTVGTAMNWTGGSMYGSGRTIIQPAATLSIAAFTGYGGVGLSDRTLENKGSVVWGGGNLSMGGAGVITNDAGASFQIQNTASFNYGGGNPRFDNVGTFLPSSAGTTAFYNIVFNNSGAINVPVGSTLSLGGGGSETGTMTVPAGATLDFAGGTYNCSVGSSITGAGILAVITGTVNFGGTVNVSGTNSFSGGTANFTGNYTCIGNTLLDISTGGVANFDGSGTVAPNTLNLNGGLGGANTVTVANSMYWYGGSMYGSGRTIIQPAATLRIAAFTGYGGVGLSDRTLENKGSMVWGGGNFGMTGVLTNDPGAVFQIQGTASFNYQGGAPRFDNAGTFLPSSASGTTSIYNIALNNYGTITLLAGILNLNCPFSETSNSVLSYPLGGNLPGVNYGQLQVPGSVTVSGTLKVSLTNHYIPATNDSFTVLTAGTRSGAFASFIYPSNSASMVLSNTPTAEIVRVTGVTLQQSNLPTAPGIISWWRAESNALDSVGTNNGTLTNGATFATGKVGQSFLLDGTNGYVVIPDSPSLRPASVTLEAWVLFNATNGFRLIMGKPVGSGNLDSFALWLADGVLNGVICDAVGGGPVLSYTMLPVIGQWYHLAYTYDGATLQQVLYVNGAAVALGTGYHGTGYDSHPMLIGSDIDNGIPDGFFSGQIDEASIYSRALGSGEIASIYNVGSAGKQLVASAAPVLHLDLVSAGVGRLYWSTNFPGYHLEYNATFISNTWAASGLPIVLVGTNFVATNSLSGARKFYRLSSVPPPFTPPPPTLKIQLISPGTVRLLWPLDADHPFLLQSTTNLSLTNWTSLSNSPSILGSNNVVTNAITGSRQFFRLSSQ